MAEEVFVDHSVLQTGEIQNEEELLSKHRKERKELQSKIVSLKKASAKADKKKKKEVLEEIAKYEMELDERQGRELAQFQAVNEINISTQVLNLGSNDSTSQNKNNAVPIQGEVEERNKQRTTKAQKRRDKKYAKSKEREEQIIAQEADNVYGARNVEIETIKALLKKRNLMIEEIPSDGNCMYCAIDFQWQLLHGKFIGLEKLRLATSEYLRANVSLFLPFITHPDTNDMLTLQQYEQYCDQVANTSAWGGEVELRALSHAFKCPIEVVQAVGPSIVFGEDFKEKTIILTYHRHMFGLGEHYNSVRPYEEPQELEEGIM